MKKIKGIICFLLCFSTFFLCSCQTSKPIANVKFYNENKLLYETKVNVGEKAQYVGENPTKESVEDGIYVINYIFDGWDKDLLICEEKDYEFNAEFHSEKIYNPKYENISNREGLKNYIINHSDEYYNGEYRCIISGYNYIAYLPSSDSFKLVYGGNYVISISFDYQKMSNASGFASINGYQSFSFSVSNHEVSRCSVSSLKDSLSSLIKLGNEFSIKKGFGFISD